MTSHRPFFSVIMACHNSEAYIAEAIQSVLNQTFNDWELIIVDDSSNDRSYEIASSFSGNERRIKFFRTGFNQGPGAARNMAVEKSSGLWLAILDSDDVFFPDKLKKQQSFIKKQGDDELVLVGTGGIVFGDGSRLERYYLYPSDSRKLKSNLYAHRKFPFHSSIVYSSHVFKQIGGFNTRYLRSQDYELWLRLSTRGKFASIREPLVRYRLNKEGVSRNRSKNGFMPRNYSIAANVCYRLRRDGLSDPSLHDVSFRELLVLIQDRYTASIFSRLDMHHSVLKNKFLARAWMGFLLVLVSNPFQSLLVIGKKLRLLSFEIHIFRIVRAKSLGRQS